MSCEDPAPAANGHGGGPERKRPAHPVPVQRHNEPVILFVTVCTRDRAPVLATAVAHAALRRGWSEEGEWIVGGYLIMPDHVHLFCAPGVSGTGAVKDWCGRWKRVVSRRTPEAKGRWLPDCWDTQMRSQEHYLRKLAYVLCNPVRRGLVEHAEDWPFRGSMNSLPWVL